MIYRGNGLAPSTLIDSVSTAIGVTYSPLAINAFGQVAFVKNLGVGTSTTNMAVYRFDTKPTTVLDFNKDKQQVFTAVKNLVASPVENTIKHASMKGFETSFNGMDVYLITHFSSIHVNRNNQYPKIF